jgi:hypothetical protein
MSYCDEQTYEKEQTVQQRLTSCNEALDAKLPDETKDANQSLQAGDDRIRATLRNMALDPGEYRDVGGHIVIRKGRELLRGCRRSP